MYFEETSKRIYPGAEHTLYFYGCVVCKKYKRISAGPLAGPGGTLSCPVCKELPDSIPGFEFSYGRIVVKPFKINLPDICTLSEV